MKYWIHSSFPICLKLQISQATSIDKCCGVWVLSEEWCSIGVTLETRTVQMVRVSVCVCACVSGVFIYTVVIAHIFVCVCLWVDNKNMHFYLTTQHTGLWSLNACGWLHYREHTHTYTHTHRSSNQTLFNGMMVFNYATEPRQHTES